MEIRVKICCISSIVEAQLAIKSGVDAIGLVGEMPSGPGIITDELAREIACIVPPGVDTFLLSSRTKADAIADHVTFCRTSAVQIVRHIDAAEYPKLLQLLPNVRLVQVIHVEDNTALELIRQYEPFVHAFLLDSGKPSATVEVLGGTGRIHDWEVSAEIVRRSSKPVFLAGGINSENVRGAIRQVSPYGIDLCSAVRTDDKLDEQKLTRFMHEVKLVRDTNPS